MCRRGARVLSAPPGLIAIFYLSLICSCFIEANFMSLHNLRVSSTYDKGDSDTRTNTRDAMWRLPIELQYFRPYIIVNRLVTIIDLQFTIRVVSNSKDVAVTKVDFVDVFVHTLIVVALNA